MNSDPTKNRDPNKKPAESAPVITLEPVVDASPSALTRIWILRPLVFVIGGFVLLVWSLLGFYLWIPLLIRTCAVFSFAIVGAVVSGHDMSRAERALSAAIGFYTRGFSVIYQSVSRVWEGRTAQPVLEGQTPISWERSIMEFFLASVMWAAPFVIHQLVQHFKPAFDVFAHNSGWR